MKKEALYWKAVENKIQCQLCPHFCLLGLGEVGKCKVRVNKAGELISLVYGRPCSLSIDPIEKKPLYHFLPGEKSVSIATAGCNLKCSHCQNYDISQCSPEEIRSLNISPEEIITEVNNNKAKIISYTYTEPTIFYEYMLDISKLAKNRDMKNTTVTNGFINPEPLKELCKYLDGSNIDLKSIDDEFYQQVCKGRVEPVLESIKIMKENNVWIEITNLLIPGLNDSTEQIEALATWIHKNLGKDVPVHFTAFYPTYKLTNLPRTSIETLKRARKIALGKGLNYVYTGNLEDEEGNNTYCPKCKKLLVKRNMFSVIENNIKNSKCIECDEVIPGIWN